MKRFSSLALGFGALTISSAAAAQVSSGSTDVVTEDVQKAVDQGDDVTDATEFDLQGGALVAGGNSKSAAVTSSTRFLLRRGKHETSLLGALNYARANQDDADTMATTIENYQGRLRYDYFFSKKTSGFLAVQARRDRFQGLDLRMGIDPGVAYSFMRRPALRLWLEGGYDLQYDVLTTETISEGLLEGTELEKSATDHNARFYFGYEQKLDERLALRAGAEFYKSLTQKGYRFNWEAELRTNLVNSLALAVGTQALYNSTPLPGVAELDVLTSLSFVYTFL